MGWRGKDKEIKKATERNREAAYERAKRLAEPAFQSKDDNTALINCGFYGWPNALRLQGNNNYVAYTEIVGPGISTDWSQETESGRPDERGHRTYSFGESAMQKDDNEVGLNAGGSARTTVHRSSIRGYKIGVNAQGASDFKMSDSEIVSPLAVAMEAKNIQQILAIFRFPEGVSTQDALAALATIYEARERPKEEVRKEFKSDRWRSLLSTGADVAKIVDVTIEVIRSIDTATWVSLIGMLAASLAS